MTEKNFEELVSAGIDSLPDEIARYIDNVAIVVADDPTPEQVKKLHLRKHTLLLGLYEGVPRAVRFSSNLLLPDKITIFKNPILTYCRDDPELVRTQVAKTIQHEVAHHFGFNEEQVRSKGL